MKLYSFLQTTSVAPHGMIDLVDCFSVTNASIKGKSFAIDITTKDTTILLFAESESDRAQWIQNIDKAITKHSSMIVNKELDNDSDDEGKDDGKAW